MRLPGRVGTGEPASRLFNYLRVVKEVGGVALILPPHVPEDLEPLLKSLDGLIISGGLDIDPALYNEERGSLTDEP